MRKKPLNNTNKNLKETAKKLKTANSLKTQTYENKQKRKIDRSCLQDYFKYHMEKCRYSDESGAKIESPGYANIAHLLPKQMYKSVMCNKLNAIYLNLNEHSRFDYLLGSHNFKALEEEFKNSWPIACERYKKLLPLVTENAVLIRTLKKYIYESQNNI